MKNRSPGQNGDDAVTSCGVADDIDRPSVICAGELFPSSPGACELMAEMWRRTSPSSVSDVVDDRRQDVN